MNEKKLQLLIVLKLIIIITFATLYAWGGMVMKWLRRYLAPCILVSTFVILQSIFGQFNWIAMITFPLLICSLSLGYGADTVGMKIFKRSYVGLAHCIALLPLYITTGNWLVYGLHCALITSFMVVLGVWNPVNARSEETLIGLSIGLLPLFTI